MSHPHRPWAGRSILRPLAATLIGAAVAAPAAPGLALATGAPATAPGHHAPSTRRPIVPEPPTWPVDSQPLHAPNTGARPATGVHKGASWTDIAFVAGGVLLVVAAAVVGRSRLRVRPFAT
jgi:hypothetical protein